MINLIKLELKRFSLKDHIRNVAIANLIILVLGILLTFISSIGEIPQSDLPTMDLFTIKIIDMLVIATFLVWESVLIAAIIVEEFRSKTMSLLFTYPINRKKLIASKLMLIVCVTLVSIIFSVLFQNLCVWGLSKVFSFVSYSIVMKDVLNLFIMSIGALCLGMLPLYVGMIRKSTIATIVSSLFIVSIAVNSQTGAGGIITIIPIAIALGALGLFFAALAIRKIVTSDLD